MGKKKHANYKYYVGEDDIGNQIREYGNSNPDNPIVLRDKSTGGMVFLRYGKKLYGGNINAH